MSRGRDKLTWLLWRLGIADVARKVLASNGRFVLEFHGVASRRYEHIPIHLQPSATVAELTQILQWVGERFTFLTPQAFLSGNKPGILLTFDDGVANNYTHALPLLEKFDAPAIFFITTQHICDPENWLPASRNLAKQIMQVGGSQAILHEFFDGMTTEQVQDCGNHPLITIGSHTVSHPFLTRIPQKQLGDELGEAKKQLEKISGQPVDYFAYPTGDYDKRVAVAVRDAGYKAAFVETARNLGLHQYEIPRVGVYMADPAYLALKLSGLHQPVLKETYI